LKKKGGQPSEHYHLPPFGMVEDWITAKCSVCACLFTTSGSVVFLAFSHNQEGIYMSQPPLSAEYMFRKIEALEAALTFAIASISVQMPAVKTDVVDGLKQNADRSDNPESVKAAFNELAALIDRVQAVPPDVFESLKK
jgi:hypothetical protein